ncbi:RCC1 domain-containing protein [Paraglaciecola sp. L3A3]|uniref:RCC1 domain-containing protein n=1 Tax=Paraglaciecola sp. L3A3 TaxID=2686358 RepID=UPI00131AA4C8|nr:RCC1 domain-containing protein [Paraglaciecola sp. L3A3]
MSCEFSEQKAQQQPAPQVGQVSLANVLTAGPFGACVIDQELNTHCWGKNYMQKDADFDCRLHPDKWGQITEVSIAGQHKPYTCFGRAYAPHDLGKVLANAETHTGVCSILAESKNSLSNIRCWGPEMNTDTPNYKDFVSISGGDRHACGIRYNGDVICWPTTSDAQQTNYNRNWAGKYPRPPAGLKAKAIASTGDAVCAIRKLDDKVVCWGGLQAPLALKAKQISVGGGWPDYSKIGKPKFPAQACAIDMSDHVICWGSGKALNVPDSLTAKSIATYSTGSCAVTLNGKGVCWGEDINLNPDFYVDEKPKGHNLQYVSAAKGAVIFIREDNSVYVYRGYQSIEKPYFIPPPLVKAYTQ